MSPDRSRRSVLAGVGSALGVALSGCLAGGPADGGGEEGAGDGAPGATTTPPAPTPTPTRPGTTAAPATRTPEPPSTTAATAFPTETPGCPAVEIDPRVSPRGYEPTEHTVTFFEDYVVVEVTARVSDPPALRGEIETCGGTETVERDLTAGEQTVEFGPYGHHCVEGYAFWLAGCRDR